jgi:membrane protease YdiL (CAAX protease family)
MIDSSPEPLSPEGLPSPNAPLESDTIRWSIADIIVFGVFFGLTVIVLPELLLRIVHIFNPEVQRTDIPAVLQVLFQVVMDLVLVGFIVFLVKVVHRASFLSAIHWFRNHAFGTGFLIALGATLAVSVLIVSSMFPPSQPPPIEKLMSSPIALYVFAAFGVVMAPLVEEIIFRGFLFQAFFDIGGAVVAIPVTAGLFTLLHIPQLWGSWAGIALIFVVGYILSLVRQKSNSLIPCFIVHTAYNGMLFAVGALTTFIQKGV